MKVFMDSMQRAYQKSLRLGFKHEEVYVHLNRAAKCFDLSAIAPNVVQDVGDETALLFKEVLDRIELLPLNEIPDVSSVESQDLTQWTVPNTEIKIVLVKEGPRQGEFLFSAGTVAHLREYYERVDHLPYKSGASVDAYEEYIDGPGPMIPQHWIRKLPEWAKFGIHDQAIWQWIGLMLTLLIAATLIVLVFRWTRHKPAATEKSDAEPTVSRWSWRRLIFPIVWMLVLLMTDHFVDEQINITGVVLTVVKISLRVLLFVASGWAIIVIGNGIAEFIITSKRAFA